jgi:hypothetical protein
VGGEGFGDIIPIMHIGSSQLRKLIISFTLLSAGLLAHTFASGSYVGFKDFLFYCAINLLLTFLITPRLLEGPRLAMIILLSQGMTHFLSGGAGNNSAQMLLSHSISSIVVYQVVKNFDQAFEKALTVIESFLPVKLTTFKVISLNYQFFTHQQIFINFPIPLGPIQLRAPPF